MVFCVYAFLFTQRSSCTQSHVIWVIAKALLIGGNGIRWVGVLVKTEGRDWWKKWMGVLSEIGWWIMLDAIHDKPWGFEDKHLWMGWCLCMNLPRDFQANTCPTRCNRIPKCTTQLKTAQFYSKNIADNDQELMMLSCQPCLKFPSIIIHSSL